METLWHASLLTRTNFYVQELKDLMVKADAITRLMERGYRVKVSLSSFSVLQMLSDNLINFYLLSDQ
jgi:phage gp29-like protein